MPLRTFSMRTEVLKLCQTRINSGDESINAM
jgi:hypothetical protein